MKNVIADPKTIKKQDNYKPNRENGTRSLKISSMIQHI